MSKAFDRVWYEGLIFKLRRYGISNELLNLIESFLRNRKQHTVLNGKTSKWGDVAAVVPQGSILGPLFFLVYINDLTENLSCNVKLFADDISLFTVIHDPIRAALDMNHDLDTIKRWAHNWRMSFNPDPNKQAVEVIFSTKRAPVDHPIIFFNDIPVMNVTQHKHLGLILDVKLSFSGHFKAAISKSRKGTRMLPLLSKYLPRKILIELYKLYVRPHLDYGDIIYHIPHKNLRLLSTYFIELSDRTAGISPIFGCFGSIGAWRGTSCEKLYDELGWESLNLRQWSRRLVLFKLLSAVRPTTTLLRKTAHQYEMPRQYRKAGCKDLALLL